MRRSTLLQPVTLVLVYTILFSYGNSLASERIQNKREKSDITRINAAFQQTKNNKQYFSRKKGRLIEYVYSKNQLGNNYSPPMRSNNINNFDSPKKITNIPRKIKVARSLKVITNNYMDYSKPECYPKSMVAKSEFNNQPYFNSSDPSFTNPKSNNRQNAFSTNLIYKLKQDNTTRTTKQVYQDSVNFQLDPTSTEGKQLMNFFKNETLIGY